MGNGTPAMICERLNGKIFTVAECRKIAERKMGEAVGDRRHGKELRATAEAWLVLAERIAQIVLYGTARAVGARARELVCSSSFLISVRAMTNRKATVLPKRESRSEKGIPFSLECGLISGRRVRVIRGC
jgi:hypothetical protein